jgi:hypothetical protein
MQTIGAAWALMAYRRRKWLSEPPNGFYAAEVPEVLPIQPLAFDEGHRLMSLRAARC